MCWVAKVPETEIKRWLPRARAEGKEELLFNEYRIPVLQDVKSSGDQFHSSVNILNSTELFT